MGLTKIIASILLLMAFVVAAQAQVTVTLVDGEGKPVAEATVEANKKVIGKTDADGTATLDASYLNQQLCFTHVGFQLFCEKVTNNVNKFTLKSNDNFLDAAVVTSYENTTRRNTVGNVSSIDMSKIPVLNTSNALSALQGLAPGLDIQVSGGGLGQASKVRVQGDQSLLFAAPPIYVVDGVVVSEYQTNQNAKYQMGGINVIPQVDNQNARGNFIDFLDFNSIESITILKDADAVAIYGSRGANGAIVIKTKKSTSNSVRLISNFNLSWQPRRIELMNTNEYLQMRKKAISNSGVTNIGGEAFFDVTLYDSTEYNNWQDIVMGHSIFNYTLGLDISSYNNGSSNRFSFNFRPNKHFYDKESHFNQFSLNNNFDKEFLNGKLRVVNVTSMGVTSSSQRALDFTSFAILSPPNLPRDIWNTEQIVWEYHNQKLFSSYLQHPLQRVRDIYKYQDLNLMNSFNIKLKVSKLISYDFLYGVVNSRSEDSYITRLNEKGIELYPNFIGNYVLKQMNSWAHNFESFFTIPEVIISNRLKLTNIMGVNYNTNNSNAYVHHYSGNPIEEFQTNINYYNSNYAKSQSIVNYKYFAVYNRLIAKYDNIIANVNYRYDGSSRFSPDNRWASFYSLGIGWNISDEKWFDIPDLYIKPKITYGRLGNDNIPDYGYLQKFDVQNSLNYPNNSIVREVNLYSRNYKWEDIRKTNLGIDLKYKSFSAQIDYSFTKSKDQLIDYALPEYLGQLSIFRNFPGVFSVRSFEALFSYNWILDNSKSFLFQFMITIPKDRLLEFPGLETSSYANSLLIGRSKNLYNYEKFGGVDKESGLYYYYDDEGKQIYAKGLASRELIETPVSYYGSFIIGFNLNKLRLSTNIYFRNEKNLISKVFNYSVNGISPGGNSNNYRFLLYDNYDVNKDSEYQKFVTDFSYMPNGYLNKINTYFIRINNLSISYSLDRLIKGKKVDISAYANNILLKTKSKNLNYEINQNTILPLLMNTGLSLMFNF